jgi:hypothetical protein
MNTISTSTTSVTHGRTRMATMAAAVAALTLGTVACGAAEGGDDYRATNHNRTSNPAPGWGPRAGDPLSPEGSERWGLGVLRYCPGSACVRTPGALLPAELRVP